jgi:hypothetical protein
MPVKSYELYEISGKLIAGGSIISPSNEVDLIFTEVPAGLYMLRLLMDEGYQNVRVVFE